MVSDIVSAVKHTETSRSLDWADSEQSFIRPFEKFTCGNYIRLLAKNLEAVKSEIKNAFGEVDYLTSKKSAENELAFVTGVMTEKAALEAIERISDNAEVLGRLRVLDY